jgi:hypothetical protein
VSDFVRLNMKKRMVAALSAVCILCGCTGEGGYKTKIKKEEQESEYSSVYAEVIEFSGFENSEYLSELNMSIMKEVEDSISEFDSLSLESVSSLPAGVKTALHITQHMKRNKGGIISFIEEHYTYLGGAHGNTVWVARNIDVRSPSPHNLELSELFVDESYIETINNLIDKLVEENPEKYSELWAQPHIGSEDRYRYYLTDEDLVIFFSPYELSYYAKGFIEFPVRMTELNGILKEEYRAEK